MKICNVCKKTFNDDIRFCPFCGKELLGGYESATVHENAAEKGTPINAKGTNDNKPNTLLKPQNKLPEKTSSVNIKSNEKTLAQNKREKTSLTEPFPVKGRIGRFRFFWMIFLLNNFFKGLMFAKMSLPSLRGINPNAAFTVIVILLAYPYILTIGQRLHDLNKSAKWAVLIYVLTFTYILEPNIIWVELIVYIGLTIIKGTTGANQYGPDPVAKKDNLKS